MLGEDDISYHCVWCEKKHRGYPVGGYIKFKAAHLCGTCMVDPEATGDAFAARFEADPARYGMEAKKAWPLAEN